MPSLRLVDTQVTEVRADGRTSHAELPGTERIVSVTDVNDAATKLQTALTPAVGGSTATTHANGFKARQSSVSGPSAHVVATVGKSGLSATYRP